MEGVKTKWVGSMGLNKNKNSPALLSTENAAVRSIDRLFLLHGLFASLNEIC